MAFFQSVRRILFFGSGVRRRLYLKMARMLSYLKPDEVLQKLIKAEEKAGFRQNRTLLFYLRRWQRQVENGKSLSEAMRGNVPDIESILVKAAERQNALGSGLEAVVRIMDAVEQIMKAVRTQFIIPVVLFLDAYGVLYFFGYKLIPQFDLVYPTRRWEGDARLLGDLATTVTTDWWLHLIFVILLLAGVFYSLPRWNGWPFSPRLRVWLDNIPPWSIYRYLNGTVFVMAMASLTAADSPEHGLYEMKQNATGRWLRSRIDRIHKYIGGGNLGIAMEKAGQGFPGPDIIHDLKTYAEHGEISSVLRQMSEDMLKNTTESASRVVRFLAVALYLGSAYLAYLMGMGIMDLNLQLSR